jgi:hypothetical protein
LPYESTSLPLSDELSFLDASVGTARLDMVNKTREKG